MNIEAAKHRLQVELVRNGIDRRVVAANLDAAATIDEMFAALDNSLAVMGGVLKAEIVKAAAENEYEGDDLAAIVGAGRRGTLSFEFDVERLFAGNSFSGLYEARRLVEMSKAVRVVRKLAMSRPLEIGLRVMVGEAVTQEDLAGELVPGIYDRLPELIDYENGEASDLEFDAAMRATFVEEGGDPDDKGAYQEWLETNSGEDYYDIVRYYGDWKLNDDGLLEPDEDGPNGFAASDAGDYYVRVHWSKEWAIGRWCAPTFPGQADARITDGHMLPGDERVEDLCVYYALPRSILDRVIEY